MSIGYFDTSALMRWVEADVASPDPRNQRIGAEVAGLIAGTDRLGVSELTLMEFRASVSDDLRRTDPEKAQMDTAWAVRSRDSIMRLVATARLEMVPLPPRAFEHAMTLVDMAAGEHQMRPRTWDGIHLITSCAWAQAENERVCLYTSDGGFAEMMAPYPGFARFADLVDLDLTTQP